MTVSGLCEAPVVLDASDRGCVLMLLDLRALVTTLAPGTLVHVAATDPAAGIDLPAWCRLTGPTWLGPTPTPGRPRYALRVAVTARSTDPHRPWQISTTRPEHST